MQRPESPAVTVYTDGSCDPNPGPGGWAAILHFSGQEVQLCGNAPETTNNRMELEAAISALAYLDGAYGTCQVDVHTDSEYLRLGITQWIESWRAQDWKTKTGAAVKNQASWLKLYDLTQRHRVRWHWVKGHASNPMNERVDGLAAEARNRLPVAGDPGPPPISGLKTASPQGPDAVRDLPLVGVSVGVSCQGSTGPGGWAAVLRFERARQIMQGRENETTPNILPLKAATEALNALKAPHNVTVYTVSDYLGKGASQWVPAWQQRGWRTASGSPVKNRGRWEALLEAAQRHVVSWQVVRGEPLPADLEEAKARAVLETAQATSSRPTTP